MIRYLGRAFPGLIRRYFSLYVLAAAGVALGVAALVGILLVNQSALAAFTGSTAVVSGSSDLSVQATGPALDESVIATVLGTPGVKDAFPVVRSRVALFPGGETRLDLFGIDLFRPVPNLVQATAGPELQVWQGIGVTSGLAAEMGWQVGDSLQLVAGARVERVAIDVLLDESSTPLPSRFTAVMDIGEAQRQFGRPGVIDQIEVVLREGADVGVVRASLSGRLGAGYAVDTPSERASEVAELLRAFRLNLVALSLVSVVVGAFLIYAAVRASLTRRRREFGVLRSLGATRRQVFVLVLSEVVLLAAAGVALGMLLGTLLAEANLQSVSATLSNLYLLSSIENVVRPPWVYTVAAATGTIAAMAGAAGPAWEIVRREPRELLSPLALHERLRGASRTLAAFGVTLMLAAFSWYMTLGSDWQASGFVLALSLLIGLPLLTPFAIKSVTAHARAHDFGIRYSARTLAAKLQVTSVAVAALGIAVALLVGVTIMIGSFRQTLDVWLATAVQADVYITTPSWARSASAPPIDSALIVELEQHPDVVAIDRLQTVRTVVAGQRIPVVAVDFAPDLPNSRFPLLDGDEDAAFAAVRRGEALISEPLARKRDLWVGDSINVATATGPRRFAIAGVYFDYSTEHGVLAVGLETMNEMFGELPFSNVALYLSPAADADYIAQRLAAIYDDRPLTFRSQRRLRLDALTVFDQTFAITKILQSLSLTIAAAGITLTLLVIARERVGELALYRALGAQRTQLFGLFLGKGLNMAALATVLGTVGGLGLAAILVFVINRAFFGWTIQLAWPLDAIAMQWLTIAVVAALASLYPALVASRSSGTALREAEA